MNKIRIFIMVFAFLISFLQITAQSLEQQEQSIFTLFEKMRLEDTDPQKDSINQLIINKFEAVLRDENAFDYPFSRLNSVGILNASDGLLRLFNWNVFHSDGSHSYYAFLLHKYKKRKAPRLYRLQDKGELPAGPNADILSANEWYGCLYYDIKPVKFGRNTVYMLTGWDAADLFSNKKVLDALYFEDNELRLGMPFINYRNKVYTRLVFEYAEQAKMVLRYDKRYDMIIWDHLAPSSPALEGKYEYYGPDGTQDGLNYERDQWVYYPDIEPVNTD